MMDSNFFLNQYERASRFKKINLEASASFQSVKNCVKDENPIVRNHILLNFFWSLNTFGASALSEFCLQLLARNWATQLSMHPCTAQKILLKIKENRELLTMELFETTNLEPDLESEFLFCFFARCYCSLDAEFEAKSDSDSFALDIFEPNDVIFFKRLLKKSADSKQIEFPDIRSELNNILLLNTGNKSENLAEIFLNSLKERPLNPVYWRIQFLTFPGFLSLQKDVQEFQKKLKMSEFLKDDEAQLLALLVLKSIEELCQSFIQDDHSILVFKQNLKTQTLLNFSKMTNTKLTQEPYFDLLFTEILTYFIQTKILFVMPGRSKNSDQFGITTLGKKIIAPFQELFTQSRQESSQLLTHTQV